jgi:hypothetical protein
MLVKTLVCHKQQFGVCKGNICPSSQRDYKYYRKSMTMTSSYINCSVGMSCSNVKKPKGLICCIIFSDERTFHVSHKVNKKCNVPRLWELVHGKRNMPVTVLKQYILCTEQKWMLRSFHFVKNTAVGTVYLNILEKSLLPWVHEHCTYKYVVF